MAEIATHNFHNMLPLRGAEVRDALAWSKHLSGAVDTFGDKSEVVIAQHHWPVFHRERARNFLIYRQTITKRPHGHPPRLSRDSISERIVCGWRCLSRV